jgi:hypothetical protein
MIKTLNRKINKKETKWVVCTADKQFPNRLTEGKMYKVLKETQHTYVILDDAGGFNWYGKNSFYVY